MGVGGGNRENSRSRPPKTVPTKELLCHRRGVGCGLCFTMRITWMPFGTPGRSWFFQPCRRTRSQRWTASIWAAAIRSICPSVVPTGGNPQCHPGCPSGRHAHGGGMWRIFVFAGAAADGGGFLGPWVEALPGMGYPTRQLRRFGYLTLQAERDSLVVSRGEEIPAMRFHHWDSTQTGTAFLAQNHRESTGGADMPQTPFLCGLSPISILGRASFGGTLCQRQRPIGKGNRDDLEGDLEKIQAGEETASAGAPALGQSGQALGELGHFGRAIVRIAALTGTAEVCLKNRALVVLCADNGVVSQGSASPDASVT